MKRIIPFFLLLVCTLSSWADPVTQEKAKQWAIGFLGNQTQSRSQDIRLDMVWDGEESRSHANPAFFVFNRTDRKGFVIVAGDDVVRPLIGYSFENNFEYKNMPANIRHWFESIKSETAAIRKMGHINSRHKQWQSRAVAGNVVKEWPTALWGQGAPYNGQCPVDPRDGKKSVTGCSATATAIVMRGYKHPTRGKGSLKPYTYTNTQNQEVNVPARSVEHDYNWENMPLKVDGSITQEQKDAIAQLMAECGQIVESAYSSGSTGGYTDRVPYAMRSNFSYSKDIRELKRDYFSNAEWENIMKAQLDEGQVLYTGTTAYREGHAYVLYGYTDQNYYAVNWGWDGYNNGFFTLNQMDPDNQGTGGSASNMAFNYNQAAIINWQKNISEVDVPQFSIYPYKQQEWGLKPDTRPLEGIVSFQNVYFSCNYGEPSDTKIIYSIFDKNGKPKGDPICTWAVNGFEGGTLVGLPTITASIPTTYAPGDFIGMAAKRADGTEYMLAGGGKNTIYRIPLGSFDYPILGDEVVMGKGQDYNVDQCGLKANVEKIKKGIDFKLTAGYLRNVETLAKGSSVSFRAAHYNKTHELKETVHQQETKISEAQLATKAAMLELNCQVKGEIEKGDYVVIEFTTDNGTTWKQLGALDELAAHIDLEEGVLCNSTTVAYDKASENITIENPLSNEYYILTLDGKTIQEGLGDKPFVIDQSKIKTGKYVLNIYKEKGSKDFFSIDLKCGKL